MCLLADGNKPLIQCDLGDGNFLIIAVHNDCYVVSTTDSRGLYCNGRYFRDAVSAVEAYHEMKSA